MLTTDLFFSMGGYALKALLNGDRKVLRWFWVAGIFAIIGIIFFVISNFVIQPIQPVFQNLAGGSIGIAIAIIFGIGAYQKAIAEKKMERTIEEVEERAREHPDQPQVAWDLARVKLESYLNRNLRQVQWIFVITCSVMTVGFGIIGYGIFRVYQSPDNFRPSIVVTVSGVIVEFIAATLLLIYRSTMDQARSYVAMLEKINAVGMSIQILDSIKTADTEKIRSQLAMELLSLYGNQQTRRETRTART